MTMELIKLDSEKHKEALHFNDIKRASISTAISFRPMRLKQLVRHKN